MKQLFGLLLLYSLSFAQEHNKIILGKIDQIYSNTLKENRKILVHLPATEPDEFSINPEYPVIYVLDGEVFFHQVVAITEGASGGSGNFNYPKMIVVGITNTDRTRDLTPTHSTDGTVMPSILLQSSGGGQKFSTFLEKELIPFIDSNYPAAPFRVIIGHSLGGLLAISDLVRQDRLFNSYIAIDPSLWWDQQSFLKQAKIDFSKTNLKNASLFVAIANTMDAGVTLRTVSKNSNPKTLPIRSILEFDKFVKAKPNNLIYKSKYYTDYDHGAVPLVAIYDAIPFIFNFYAIDFPFGQFFNPSYQNDDILSNHYSEVSKRMGYTISPPGEFVDALAHQLMDSKQLNRAYKFLQLNLKNYPDSYRPYESMGDHYQAKDDKVNAEKFYLQALTKKEKTEIRAKIEKLKGN